MDNALFWALGITVALITSVVTSWARAIMKRLDSIDVKLEGLVRLEEQHKSTVDRVVRLETLSPIDGRMV